MLNNENAVCSMPAEYYSMFQPYDYHSNVPSKLIYCYNFSLTPEEYQPSGTCNFLNLHEKHILLDIDTNPSNLSSPDISTNLYATSSSIATSGTLNFSIFALNYNKLKIRTGVIVD